MWVPQALFEDACGILGIIGRVKWMNLSISMKVFVIDDEQTIVEWLVNHVDWGVYNCEIVGYSTQASDVLDYLDRSSIDLLITDISMPDMTGLELIEAVKKKNPNVSVIIISAYSKFEYVKEAIKYGVINYLLKPINVEELYDCLKIAEMDREKRWNEYDTKDVMVFRNSVLHELITGGYDECRFEEQCALAGITLDAAFYQVVVLNTSDIDNSRYLSLVKRLTAKKGNGYYCFFGTRMNLVILMFGEQDTKMENERKIAGLIMKEGLWDFFLCVGKPLTDYRQIPKSYQGCCDFLNAKFLFAGKAVRMERYAYEKYQEALKSEYLLRLSNVLQTDDKEGVIYALKKQVESIKSEVAKQEELICLAVYIVKNINLIHPSWEIILPSKSLESQKTSADMMEWIEKFYSEMVTVAREKDNGLYSYVNRMLQEVNNHYSDKDLSLQRIAEVCGITTAYMGKLFHAQTGEFFNDYLLRIRLKAAETLLAESKRNIGEISQVVGFSSQSYFNKMFRKTYGMSPMEYRNRIRHMEQRSL